MCLGSYALGHAKSKDLPLGRIASFSTAKAVIRMASQVVKHEAAHENEPRLAVPSCHGMTQP